MEVAVGVPETTGFPGSEGATELDIGSEKKVRKSKKEQLISKMMKNDLFSLPSNTLNIYLIICAKLSEYLILAWCG